MTDILSILRGRNPCLSIVDEAHCRTTLDRIKTKTCQELHVITDFDMTLTKHWIHDAQGELIRNLSSHGVLERGPAVSPEFAKRTEDLVKHYYPFEIAQIPIKRKTQLMIEWWTKAHEMMIAEGITRRQVTQQAEYAKMSFRDGLPEFMDVLERNNVPLLIFSAGIADVIEELLRVNALVRKNQAVIANHMHFDGDRLVDFRDPLIHVLNKGEQALHSGSSVSTELRDTLSTRKSVILMGDSIGDARMADGVQHDAVIKIGFCNFGDEARIKEFKDAFDIVITGDSGLQCVTELIDWISS